MRYYAAFAALLALSPAFASDAAGDASQLPIIADAAAATMPPMIFASARHFHLAMPPPAASAYAIADASRADSVP
jgi:hypothetical protein